MEKFLARHNFPTVTQEETFLNIHMSTKVIKVILRNVFKKKKKKEMFSQRKFLGPDGSIGELCQTFKEEIIPIL